MTAAAQTSENLSTAQANAILGNVNQYTPYGSLEYKQTGNKFVSDPTSGTTYYVSPTGEYTTTAPTGAPSQSVGSGSAQPSVLDRMAALGGQGTSSDGGQSYGAPSNGAASSGASNGGGLPAGWTTQKGYYIPSYSAYQNLSPQEQKIFDATEAAKANLGNIAKDQSAFLSDYLSHPADLSNEAVTKSLFDLGRKRLDPMFATQQNQMSADLANKGIMIGSDAYNTAQRQQGQKENDAYNQLLLTGQGQAFQQAAAARNQPINEITALLSGSQVTPPNFVNPNMPTIPTTDYAGLVNTNYNQQMGVYNAQAQQAAQQNQMTQSILGGMFGLGAAGIYRSDRRSKTNIRKVGKLANGLNVYRFRYKSGGPMQIGLMADEVEKIHPHAVLTGPDGYKLVNYNLAVL